MYKWILVTHRWWRLSIGPWTRATVDCFRATETGSRYWEPKPTRSQRLFAIRYLLLLVSQSMSFLPLLDHETLQQPELNFVRNVKCVYKVLIYLWNIFGMLLLKIKTNTKISVKAYLLSYKQLMFELDELKT